MNYNFIDDNNLDISMMFELDYKLSEIFENPENKYLNTELPAENDNGFIEYKRNLLSYENKLSKLKTQIYWRMSEGLTYNSSNSCYYIIGIDDNGTIQKVITHDEIIKSLEIVYKCTIQSNIKYIYRQIIYNDSILVIIKFWKEETLLNNDIRIILLGASESNKTKFFIDLHNNKLNIAKNITFQSNQYDIHSDETKLEKTLVLHHQYSNIILKKVISLININDSKDINDNLEFSEQEGVHIHIIDTPGNSIISNIKYLVSYNADIIIHFNQNNKLYCNILNIINHNYNNVLNITDTTYLQDFNSKKLLLQALIKNKTKTKILRDINDILLINETRLMKSSFNKQIFYCYNFMNMNIFDKINDIYIRNIQHKYNYKSSIKSNNSISIETNKIIYKPILGNTKILETLEIPDFNLEDNDYMITYNILILNQIYLINSKNIPNKIIFDKIILIPENYKSIPIFIIWYKNNEYFIKIFDYINISCKE
jgi:hypothetical protein